MPTMHFRGIALVLLAVGCVSPRDTGPLGAVEAWTLLDAAQDPFDDRPESVDCNPRGHGVEGDIYEVETDECAYATLSMPTEMDLFAGDSVLARAWHLTLTALEVTEGHLSLQLGDETLLDIRPTIPGMADTYEATVELQADAPAGTPLYLHVHNHGVNSWRARVPELIP